MKKPQNSRAGFEQALALERAGRNHEAAALYRTVISRNAQHDRALFRLGVLLMQTGNLASANDYFERAVAIRRDEPEYLTKLAESYRLQGKLELASTVLAYALSQNPDFPEAHEELAVIQLQTGALGEALAHLERVVQLRPNAALARVKLAWALLLCNRPKQALASAQRALELAPHLALAHRCVGDAFDMLGDKQRSIPSYRRVVELDPQNRVSHSNLIVSMLTDSGSDAAAILAEARAWSKLHAEPLRAQVRAHENDKQPERRLRVGYVSPDFSVHAIQQFLVPLLEHHDPACVEVFLYSAVERPDTRTAWYRAFAGKNFREIQGLSDVAAAELVRADGIDILVDLAVHGAGNRLGVFACKPAPVQITWLGYASTTGLDTIDYRISDPYLDPPGADLGVYSETTLRLPETFWCYAALESELPVTALPALTRRFVTFGSMNNPRKISAPAVALWARVLGAVPRSRLLVHLEQYGREALLEALAARGIEAPRVEFAPRVSRRAYLERHSEIDIALDTFPFAGGTTTLDALWMGVPVVTLSGRTALQRAGVSIAMNLGLPELVAQTEDEFVARAAALAGDLAQLSALRATLRARLEASPLGDAPRFARQLEAAYRGAWREYCAR